MFKLFMCFLILISRFSVDCMESHIACVNLINSTNEKVRLTYIKSPLDISKITKTEKDWDGKALEIDPGKPIMLLEAFSDFNQFGMGENETEMCKINVEYEETLVATICLICSMYSPCPFFDFKNVSNRFGVFLYKKEPIGGGLTTFKIANLSRNIHP